MPRSTRRWENIFSLRVKTEEMLTRHEIWSTRSKERESMPVFFVEWSTEMLNDNDAV